MYFVWFLQKRRKHTQKQFSEREINKQRKKNQELNDSRGDDDESSTAEVKIKTDLRYAIYLSDMEQTWMGRRKITTKKVMKKIIRSV